MTKTNGKSAAIKSHVAKFTPKDYDQLIGMEGFSEKLLTTHFKLYQGYVTNTNTLLEELDHLLDQEPEKNPAFAEMKRRLGWELNGMRLHEYYFDNLTKSPESREHHPVVDLINANFGSMEKWKKDFVSTGAMRGIGWVVLCGDPQSDRLFNMWIDEHNVNHVAGSQPLLVMDVFEHAYMNDYGTDRAKYIDAFFRNINWDVVNERADY